MVRKDPTENLMPLLTKHGQWRSLRGPSINSYGRKTVDNRSQRHKVPPQILSSQSLQSSKYEDDIRGQKARKDRWLDGWEGCNERQEVMGGRVKRAAEENVKKIGWGREDVRGWRRARAVEGGYSRPYRVMKVFLVQISIVTIILFVRDLEAMQEDAPRYATNEFEGK